MTTTTGTGTNQTVTATAPFDESVFIHEDFIPLEEEDIEFVQLTNEVVVITRWEQATQTWTATIEGAGIVARETTERDARLLAAKYIAENTGLFHFAGHCCKCESPIKVLDPNPIILKICPVCNDLVCPF